MTTFSYSMNIPPDADLERAQEHAKSEASRLCEDLDLKGVKVEMGVIPRGAMEMLDCHPGTALGCGIDVAQVVITVTGRITPAVSAA